MSDIGSTFRYFRKAKRMTLKQTSDGIVSVQFLSRFEKNESDISLSNFLSLLKRINVDISEFKLLSEDLGDKSQQQFLAQYGDAYRKQNLVKLSELIDSQTKLYLNSDNIRHYHNVIILNQRLKKIYGKPFDKEEAKVIFKYLLNSDEWQYYEVSLFGNSTFFMNRSQIENLSHTANKRSLRYDNLQVNSSNYALIMMNVINLFFDQDYLEPIAPLIKDIEYKLSKHNYFYDKNHLNFIKGVYKIRIGQVDEGVELCQESIRLMSHFGASEVANILQLELEALLLRINSEI
ncbi:helix-turn-helix domain-containing protein [Fundicoccus culcitae]|uniref:Helix-turn-helix domain-containing protein n=1 Tax=Fundicoccus culcitae TaxID=2969821 RepID=A0ABY5P778_9LACT|nr:Rgg/GadR/MutR family transcriptional regulator [Fundicoccus culcitae]UUX34340.1 helix-turn-helix domain-containing protein [Fundicoccus culcitae]